MRVLIAEDYPDQRKLLAFHVHRLVPGAEVIEVDNAQEALIHLETGAFDLIFVDLTLREPGDGWAVLERTRRQSDPFTVVLSEIGRAHV